jgi:mannose-6-phosphate isomerase-like protein (cupin superfamily)
MDWVWTQSASIRRLTAHPPFLCEVLGLGLALLYSSIDKELGITARMKVVWHYLWKWESKDDAPLRRPSLATDSNDFVQSSDDGSVQLLVSPKNAATWRLNVSLVTIQPGREIPSFTTRFVEFYYVLSGAGKLSQSGIVETLDIHKGHTFVVDPGTVRWMSNSKSIEPLVLLRATDGGNVYSRPSFDCIRPDPNRKSTITSLRDGLKQVESLAKTYYSNTNN